MRVHFFAAMLIENRERERAKVDEEKVNKKGNNQLFMVNV